MDKNYLFIYANDRPDMHTAYLQISNKLFPSEKVFYPTPFLIKKRRYLQLFRRLLESLLNIKRLGDIKIYEMDGFPKLHSFLIFFIDYLAIGSYVKNKNDKYFVCLSQSHAPRLINALRRDGYKWIGYQHGDYYHNGRNSIFNSDADFLLVWSNHQVQWLKENNYKGVPIVVGKLSMNFNSATPNDIANKNEIYFLEDGSVLSGMQNELRSVAAYVLSNGSKLVVILKPGRCREEIENFSNAWNMLGVSVVFTDLNSVPSHSKIICMASSGVYDLTLKADSMCVLFGKKSAINKSLFKEISVEINDELSNKEVISEIDRSFNVEMDEILKKIYDYNGSKYVNDCLYYKNVVKSNFV